MPWPPKAHLLLWAYSKGQVILAVWGWRRQGRAFKLWWQVYGFDVRIAQTFGHLDRR